MTKKIMLICIYSCSDPRIYIETILVPIFLLVKKKKKNFKFGAPNGVMSIIVLNHKGTIANLFFIFWCFHSCFYLAVPFPFFFFWVNGPFLDFEQGLCPI